MTLYGHRIPYLALFLPYVGVWLTGSKISKMRKRRRKKKIYIYEEDETSALLELASQQAKNEGGKWKGIYKKGKV